MEEREKGFESWGIVEVMGHQTFAGLVSEQVVAGAAFVRVDVPAVDAEGEPGRPAFTKLLGPGSIYAITPTSEEVARAAARRCGSKPVNVYMPELNPPPATRRALAAARETFEPDDDEDDSDVYDDRQQGDRW